MGLFSRRFFGWCLFGAFFMLMLMLVFTFVSRMNLLALHVQLDDIPYLSGARGWLNQCLTSLHCLHRICDRFVLDFWRFKRHANLAIVAEVNFWLLGNHENQFHRGFSF